MSRIGAVLLLATVFGASGPLQAQEPRAQGEWAISFELPQGSVALSVALQRDEERWVGAADVTHVGPARVPDITIEASRVSFRVEVQYEGHWYALNFSGEMDDDEIDGSVSLPDGNRTAFRAVRSGDGSTRPGR